MLKLLFLSSQPHSLTHTHSLSLSLTEYLLLACLPYRAILSLPPSLLTRAVSLPYPLASSTLSFAPLSSSSLPYPRLLPFP